MRSLRQGVRARISIEGLNAASLADPNCYAYVRHAQLRMGHRPCALASSDAATGVGAGAGAAAVGGSAAQAAAADAATQLRDVADASDGASHESIVIASLSAEELAQYIFIDFEP